MKPLIGVTPLFDEDKNSIWMLPGYMNGISEAGGLPIILPLEMKNDEFNQIYELCDGFLMTGGQDVNPTCYKEEVSQHCGKWNDMRDRLELMILHKAYEDNKVVLGICRGFHLINVMLGGTLYQDLPMLFQGNTEIQHAMEAPYDRKFHTVRIHNDSPLALCVEKEEIGVNSYHHQGIKKLGMDLDIMASAQDGLIEAVCSRSKKFLWGVQWHPEFLYPTDEDNKKIFEAFIRAAKKNI